MNEVMYGKVELATGAGVRPLQVGSLGVSGAATWDEKPLLEALTLPISVMDKFVRRSVRPTAPHDAREVAFINLNSAIGR
ncbi:MULTISPECIES: hypothetical protein [Citromicrobium]|uniref:hypothetical protein n=1 Tax=Citromicrobium TaxID=72173 RepID=UPI0012E20B28|nr:MULTISPECIES: hypothetical protein [Citromicrobium]